MFNPLTAFTALHNVSTTWYSKMCEPHSGELTHAQQTVLMALEFGMPEVLCGDSDGACFVVNLEGSKAGTGMVGTTGLCTLWVTEDLELTIIPVSGPGQAFQITPEQLIAEYALVPVNPALEGWLA
jgi:hypothetical protein